MRLRLRREWVLGDRIGSGGFGQVYEARSPDMTAAVAKLIPKSSGAQRELLFVDLGKARNVVPVIDSGDTDASWVLIMPRAERSLRQHLERMDGALPVTEAVEALLDVAAALADLDGKVVHRDLKPENVLLLNGSWCLADFGISRYAEATTAPDTQKYSLSPPYAAPERWRGERATIATDVYSFGVIAYELVSGSLPFKGPKLEDFREQHLHADPPNLRNIPSGLAALIDECLYKAPGARPSPSNLVTRLSKVQPSPLPGLARLQEANRVQAARRGEATRRESESRSDAEKREALLEAATRSLERISNVVREQITMAAPSARVQLGRNGGWSIILNNAQLQFAECAVNSPKPWGAWEAPAFDVVAHAAVGVRIPANSVGYEGRSHSLWFCDAQEEGRYCWFEAAFMVSPLIPKRGRQDPFALLPGEESAKALWRGMAEFQVAWPFTAINVNDLNEFVSRWAGWFAEAAEGRLQLPSPMPERPCEGSWRRG